jgi:hypothetical protein
MPFKSERQLSRSHCRPLLDLLLFAEEIVDFDLQRPKPFLLPVCRRLSVFHKAVNQPDPAAPRSWRVPPELTALYVDPFCSASRGVLSIGGSNGREKSRVPFLGMRRQLPSPGRCWGRGRSREPVELRSVYRSHAAASEESACHIAPQSPSDRSKATISPAPEVSFVAASAAVGSDRDRLTCRLRGPAKESNFGVVWLVTSTSCRLSSELRIRRERYPRRSLTVLRQ